MPTRYLPLALLCIAGLLGAEPKRDRYGEPLPEGAIARLGSLRLRPKQPVFTGAFSPDGKLLATGGGAVAGRGVITFWDPTTGKETRRLTLPFRVHGMRFSSDGKSLIVVGNSGRFRIIDAASGAEQRKLDPLGDNPLLAVDVARDGKTAVTTDFRGNIVISDLVRGKRLLERKVPVNRFHWNDRSPFRPLTALTPDGKQVVLPQADCSLHLVNVASGEKVIAFEMPESQPKGASHLELPSVAVSPDGRYLAYASTWVPAVLCDLKTGKILHPLTARSTNSMRCLFTPDSRSVIVHSGNAIHLFDTASGKEIRKIENSSWMGHPLALSPDGKRLALMVGQHAISLWDLSTGRQIHSIVRHTSLVQSIVFFPDGKRLASSDHSGNRIVWDIASAQVVAHHHGVYDSPRSLAVDVDGKTLRFLTANYLIHRWNPDAGGKASQQKLPQTNLVEFVLSPDGRTLAATIMATPVTQVLLRDLQGDKAARTITMPKNVRIGNLLFSPDSRLLLVGASDSTLRLWDRDTGKLLRELPAEDPKRAPSYWTFANDGRSLAYFEYGAGFGVLGFGVRIREIASGGLRLQVPLRGGGGMPAYSPDGRFLACAHSNGGILVLGTATGKELARWQGPQGTVFSLAFSPDNRLLASGYGDGTILLWKLPDGEGLPATLKEKEAVALWQALADDAARANRALAGLAAASAQAVPLIKQRFRTVWTKPDAKRLAQLIADLDNDAFKVREQATRELSEAGVDAADALRQAFANNPSAEAKKRLEALLNRLNEGGGSERLRSLRAIEVLERIGTPQAKDVLRELNRESLPAELREEIEASLRRMKERL
jgi:WD40 repeat protein